MKRILMLCCAVLLFCQTVAFAHEMPDEEMYIGGITVGDTLGYAKLIMGAPEQIIRQKYTEKRDVEYLYSHEKLLVRGEMEWEKKVEEDDLIIWNISIHDNQWTTPSGMTTGMPYAEVVALFGESSKVHRTMKHEMHLYKGQKRNMSFFVDSQTGLISSIGVISPSFQGI